MDATPSGTTTWARSAGVAEPLRQHLRRGLPRPDEGPLDLKAPNRHFSAGREAPLPSQPSFPLLPRRWPLSPFFLALSGKRVYNMLVLLSAFPTCPFAVVSFPRDPRALSPRGEDSSRPREERMSRRFNSIWNLAYTRRSPTRSFPISPVAATSCYGVKGMAVPLHDRRSGPPAAAGGHEQGRQGHL